MVFHDLDRFTRNIAEFFIYTKDLIKAGITLHLAVDGEIYDYHSEEKWHQRLVAGQAESKRISRRTQRGQRTATRMGLHIGKPPWGYMLVHDSDEVNDKGEPVMCGRLVPDPELWDHVVKLFSMSTDGSTAMQIARYNRQHNVPSPSGGPWTDGSVRYIQKNEKYSGRLFRGKNPQSRLPGPKENAAEIVLENAHQAAVSPENFEKINEGIRSRHRDQGPTRCHSSPSPASGLLKCGPCWSRGIDSNLEINRQKGTVRLRCSKKKRMGREFCTFTGARLDEVLEALQDRLNNNFLTEDTLDRVIGRVADASREYLEEQETNRAGIRARKGVLRDKIASLKVTLDDAGLGPRSRRSLTDDLEKLLEEQEELDQEDKRISEATEDARIFVSNRAGIIETAMNLKTYTDPEDLEAQRELMHLFIERVEVFHDGRGVIEYDLPVHCEGSADGQTREAIYFKRTKDPVASQSCGFDGSMGMDPMCIPAEPEVRGRPRGLVDGPLVKTDWHEERQESPEGTGD